MAYRLPPPHQEKQWGARRQSKISPWPHSWKSFKPGPAPLLGSFCCHLPALYLDAGLFIYLVHRKAVGRGKNFPGSQDSGRQGKKEDWRLLELGPAGVACDYWGQVLPGNQHRSALPQPEFILLIIRLAHLSSLQGFERAGGTLYLSFLEPFLPDLFGTLPNLTN